MNLKAILKRFIGSFGFDAASFVALGMSAGAAFMPATAHGQIYVANQDSGTIGEYTTSGDTVEASLVSTLSSPVDIAFSGADLFVANVGSNSIGEYTTSGAVVNASLISTTTPLGVAVSGSDLFVVVPGGNNGSISEYTTSGTLLNASLVTGLAGAFGLAASGSDLFVTNTNNATVGEYTTSGATVNASLISGVTGWGIAVSGSDLFVVSGDTIGEYTTSGAVVNASLISGLSTPEGIAVSGSDLFVTNHNGTIGEYTTSGATVNASLVSGLSAPEGIAVEPPPGPANLTWNNTGGSGDGMTWDTTSQNWNDGTGPNVYTDGSNVTFNDANNGNYAVTLNATVSPGSVTVNNSAGNYTISGTGSIAGTGSLTKMGSGTLTLNTVNTYSGGTTVSAGTLEVGATGALLNGNVTINGGTFQIASGGSVSVSSMTVDSGGAISQTGGTASGQLELGTFLGSVGTYTLASGGTLSSGEEIVGVSGSGTFIQTGGTNTLFFGELDVGGNPGAGGGGTGSYTLASGTLSSLDEFIGSGEYTGGEFGTGTFTQTGGTNTLSGPSDLDPELDVGFGYLSTGTYTLASGAILSSYNEVIGGYGATGTFNQTGGTNTVSNELDVGGTYEGPGGGTGSYTLASGATLFSSVEAIGTGGYSTGTFDQTGGTNTVSQDLFVGYGGGSVGSYTISGGTLDATNVSISFNDGVGVLTVSGTGLLNVPGTITAYNSFNGPNYTTINLNGGTINVGSLNLSGNPGVLNWTAGTLNLTDSSLTVGSGGTLGSSLTLGSGQTLDISGSGQGLTVTGTMNLSGGNLATGSLSVTGGAFNWTAGTLNLTNSSLMVGSGGTLGSTLTLGSGQTLDISGSGQSLTVTGTMNVSGGGLSVPTIAQSAGTFTDTGTLALASSGGNAVTYNLSGGAANLGAISVGSGGAFNWTAGTLNLTNSNLTVSAGGALGSSLTLGSGQTLQVSGSGAELEVTGTLQIGNGGSISAGLVTVDSGGAVNQTGGTNTVGVELAVGPNSTGSYTLASGAALSSPYEVIGINGTGTFNQTGGTNTVGGELDLGYYNTGSYTLASGAALSSPVEVIGFYSTGTFNQTGGTNTVNTLNVGGENPYFKIIYRANGSYTLGGGILSSNYEEIGNEGTGAFTQTGGTNTVGSELDVGDTLRGTGSYTLASGAALSSPVEVIGENDGTGTFNQTGGTNTTSSLTIALNAGATGAYMLSGGSCAVSGNLQVNSGGSLTQSGSGSLSAGSITLAGGTITENTVGSIVTPSLTQTGGTLIVPSLTPGPGGIGSYNWTGGTLHLTASNLEIGGSGLFGSSLSLPSGQTLIEDVGVTVDPGSLLNLQGGGLTVSAGATLNNSGTFNETSGSLTVNGAFINSGTATFGGTQSWGPASVFANLAGAATFNSAIDPGGTGPIIDVTGGNVIYNGGGAELPSTLTGLSIAALGEFDLTNSHLFINYGANPDPIATIRGYLVSGYNGGAWNGIGIDSSTAAVNHNYAVGYADSADPSNPAELSSDQIEIKYTLYGDANLDGKVNSVDLGILAANFGDSGKVWDQGNFNYDPSGKVNSVDLGLLAENFGQSASGADVALPENDWAALDAFAAANGVQLTNVPEPTFLGLSMLAAVGVLVRRRRR